MTPVRVIRRSIRDWALPVLAALTWDIAVSQDFACRPQSCSTLLPAGTPDAPAINDCAYRNRNQWWLDYVGGSLAWSDSDDAPRKPVTVAVFDDGVDIHHEDLDGQLWTNSSEAQGKPGIDDDGNGYVDDVHGWDFVDNDPNVSPERECVGRASHGTFMASLIAAKKNNGIGIAAAGSDGARVMALRIVGCGKGNHDRADPDRIQNALDYATRMGAKILSFSNHWYVSSPSLDAAFADVTDSDRSPRAAIIVASVPNRGEAKVGYPAAYAYKRIVRAIPIGNDDEISPGTSAAPVGLNLGSPSACVIGATSAPAGYAITNGSSNSTAILAGLLAGIWSTPAYATFSPDEFVATVVRGTMSGTVRRSRAGSRPPYLNGVPLADACLLQTTRRSAQICRPPSH
jgi:subtilisin family serine protease